MFLLVTSAISSQESGKVVYRNRYIFAHSLAGDGSVARSAEWGGRLRAAFAVGIFPPIYVCETDSIIG